MTHTLTRVRTTINGEAVEFLCEPRQSLLECLRDILGLTGTKEGCNDGNCGACTVIMDGRIVNSCLVLGVEVEGREIITIEGIAQGGRLHPLQRAFRKIWPCNAVSARLDSSWRSSHCWIRTQTQVKSRFASGWPTISAAVQATTRSFMRSARLPPRCRR